MYQVFVKENKDLIHFHVYYNFNDSLSTLFPAALKCSNLKSSYKKDKKTDKTIYKPINIFPNINKQRIHA